MARTTYLAPGVYVEEIPSAQQPIAGVGTNTVGFVGVVGPAIYYPVREDLYDPVVARAVLFLKASQQDKATADAKDVERNQAIAKAQTDRMEAESKTLEERLVAADKAVQDIGADPTRATERERAAATAEQIRKQRDDLVKARQDLQRAQQPGGSTPPAESAEKQDQLTEPSVLRPYRLVKFDVDVEPFDTKLCTNFSEYTNLFGPFSADDFNARPGTALDPGHRALTHAVYGFFKNGGTRCFVARITEKNAEQLDKALAAMESIDAVAIVAAPGIDGLDAWGKLVAHCDTTEDRFAILDCPEVVESEPRATTGPASPARPARGAAAAAGATPAAGAPAAGAVTTTGELNVKLLSYETPGHVLPPRSKNAAFYFPYIEVIDPAKQVQDEDPARQVPLKYRGRVYVPPSGHVAGIYARTDEQRGVHKAPANVTVLRGGRPEVLREQAEAGAPEPPRCELHPRHERQHRRLGCPDDRRGPERGVEIHQRAPVLPVPAGVDRRGHPVGGVRAQRSGAVGQDPAQRERVLDQRLAVGRALRPHASGGVLREVRCGDESARGS